jgi:sulfonate transport system permease protein
VTSIETLPEPLLPVPAPDDGAVRFSGPEASPRDAAPPGGAPSSDALVEPRLADQAREWRRSTLTALRVVAPATLLLLWWAGTASGRISEQTFASPGSVWAAFWDLLTSGELWANLSVSLTRAFTGLAIGLTIGLVLGVVTGLSRLVDGLVDPLMQMAYTVPFLAVAPLLIVWFGIGEQPKLVLITVATCLPVYLNTCSGVRNADRKVIEVARVFGVSRVRLVRQIVIPSAIPSILVGLRMALTFSLIALIVVEQTNSPKGIGFLMLSAQQYFQTEILIVCILLYALWGLTAGGIVRGLTWLLQPWQRKGNVR